MDRGKFLRPRTTLPRVPAPVDLALCDALAVRASAGDRDAWRTLVEHLWPAWLDMVRAHRALGPLRESDDHVHDLLADLVEKLGANGGRTPGWTAPQSSEPPRDRRRSPDQTPGRGERVGAWHASAPFGRAQSICAYSRVVTAEPNGTCLPAKITRFFWMARPHRGCGLWIEPGSPPPAAASAPLPAAPAPPSAPTSAAPTASSSAPARAAPPRRLVPRHAPRP
jgi:hypothetical protein